MATCATSWPAWTPYRAKYPAIDPRPPRPHRLELRRIHDHVRRHADHRFKRRGRRRGHLRLEELLRRKLHRPVDDAVLRRHPSTTIPRSTRRARPSTSSKRQDSDAGRRGRPRRRVPGAAVLRVLARAAGQASRPSWSSIPTKATASPAILRRDTAASLPESTNTSSAWPVAPTLRSRRS
jgi:hypothetical protein